MRLAENKSSQLFVHVHYVMNTAPVTSVSTVLESEAPRTIQQHPRPYVGLSATSFPNLLQAMNFSGKIQKHCMKLG